MCPPFVQWTVKPFYFPSVFFFFSFLLPFFFFFLTDDVQINDRSIAGGSPMGRDWECWGQKFLMHLTWGGVLASNRGRQPRVSLVWTVWEAVFILKLGSENEGKDPGGRSFNPQRRGQGHMRTSQEERRLVLASWMLSWSQWRWKSLPGQLAQNYFILLAL